MKPTLYLIRGVPGCGKSTLAHSMLNNGLVACVFEADQYFKPEGWASMNDQQRRVELEEME